MPYHGFTFPARIHITETAPRQRRPPVVLDIHHEYLRSGPNQDPQQADTIQDKRKHSQACYKPPRCSGVCSRTCGALPGSHSYCRAHRHPHPNIPEPDRCCQHVQLGEQRPADNHLCYGLTCAKHTPNADMPRDSPVLLQAAQGTGGRPGSPVRPEQLEDKLKREIWHHKPEREAPPPWPWQLAGHCTACAAWLLASAPRFCRHAVRTLPHRRNLR